MGLLVGSTATAVVLKSTLELAEPSPSPVAPASLVPPKPSVVMVEGVKATLSSARAKDGGIILVSVTIPSKFKIKGESSIVGEFEREQLPFFTAAKKGVYQAAIGVPYNHKPTTVDVKITVTPVRGSNSMVMMIFCIGYAFPAAVIIIWTAARTRAIAFSMPPFGNDFAASDACW